MAYSAVLELFGALDRGRVDPRIFHSSCAHLLLCLRSYRKKDVEWFVDVDHVYAESRDEGAILDWISTVSAAGLKIKAEAPILTWAIRGVVVDGSLGIASDGLRGLTTSIEKVGVLAELRTSLRNFHGVGVRVGWLSESDEARNLTFTNILYNGRADIPYSLFTDIRPKGAAEVKFERLKSLVTLASSVAKHSKLMARNYISAITRVLLNSDAANLGPTIELLSGARSVEGIELAGLILINRAYGTDELDPEVSKALIEFPRLDLLCKRLQEGHAFPIGLVNKAAINRYLNDVTWG